MQLLSHQEDLRNTLSHATFMKRARSWFEAWLKKWLGDRHVAKAIIRSGVGDVKFVSVLRTVLVQEEREEKKKKRDALEKNNPAPWQQHGAEEPVWMFRQRARLARKTLRRTQNLMLKVENGVLDIDYLPYKQKMLLEDLASNKLHVDVDKANTAYGHGVARTHDYGFVPGEDVWKPVPMDVKAHLRQLRSRAGAAASDRTP